LHISNRIQKLLKDTVSLQAVAQLKQYTAATKWYPFWSSQHFTQNTAATKSYCFPCERLHISNRTQQQLKDTLFEAVKHLKQNTATTKRYCFSSSQQHLTQNTAATKRYFFPCERSLINKMQRLLKDIVSLWVVNTSHKTQ